MGLKKYLSAVLSTVLLLQGMAASVGIQAEEQKVIYSEYACNPAYTSLLPGESECEGVCAETEFARYEENPKAEVYFDSIEDVTDALEQGMINREKEIVIGVKDELFAPYHKQYGNEAGFYLMEETGLHGTGNPKGGDYLVFHTQGWGTWFYADGDGWTLCYQFLYSSTREQEQMVDEAVAKLVAGWKKEGLTGLDAINAIYNYITTNVEYDFDGLEAYVEAENNGTLTPAHEEIFTAYAALIKGKSVCQGYATLFYRLALEMGIDARFISGWGGNAQEGYERHGWNIVECYGRYYNIDTTWDAGMLEYGYEYYMASEADFADHIRDDAYCGEDFYAAYPMASSTIHYTREANPGEITFTVPRATTTWKPDGKWYVGEYFEVPTEMGWVSVSVGNPEHYITAKRLQPFLAMSWDENYIYTMLEFHDPNGHVNLCGSDPGMMWNAGCVQAAFADADSTGDSRLEYGIGVTSDEAARMLSHVWADYLDSGYVPSEEDFGVTMMDVESGLVMIYEFRTPISAFSTNEKAAAGDEYGVCYNISWGNGDTHAHTQLGAGISGDAGKAAQYFMHFTLVEELCGDLNGDSMLNEDDVSAISDWFAGKTDDLPFDTAKADINGDGEFSRADGMYLARAIAGWKGYTLS